ncbi:hypothetical protein KC887_01200 [Candidatus Kaiserbacteria bacterium]|nr:hypothetical protein [Candidatus Kaiserbacteria bacterium]
MIGVDISVDGLESALKQIGAFDSLPDGVVGAVFSGGAYGPSGRYEQYVQSAQHQAAVHQGRWQTDEDVAAKRADDVRNEFAQMVRTIASGGRVSVRSAVGRALKIIYDDMIVYPPPPAGSRYVRTGELRSSYRYETKV